MSTETTPVDISKEPPTPGPGPCSVDIIPVHATINDMELALYFESSIGEATVTVTDDSGQVVYLENVDTCTTSEVHIPVDLWSAGNYTLTITYDTTVLRGNFTVE